MKDTSWQSVLDFWFQSLQPADWWKKSPSLDKAIAEKFAPLLQAAKRGELYLWRENIHGRLAEIIVLDQFSRNIFRDSARAFEADALAVVLSQEALLHDKQELPGRERAFLYMPLMHSESPMIHRLALEVFSAPDLHLNLDFEKQHKDIIDRFGRYPHRNAVLGRTSTPEELTFLETHKGF